MQPFTHNDTHTNPLKHNKPYQGLGEDSKSLAPGFVIFLVKKNLRSIEALLSLFSPFWGAGRRSQGPNRTGFMQPGLRSTLQPDDPHLFTSLCATGAAIEPGGGMDLSRAADPKRQRLGYCISRANVAWEFAR